MKKLLVLLLFMLCATSAMADEKSDKVLSEMGAKVTSLGDYKVKMTFTQDSTYEGEFFVSRERYYMNYPSAMGFQLICDGETRYEIQTRDKDVRVSNVDPDDRMAPTSMFIFTGDDFIHEYIGTQSINGVLCDVIALKSTNIYEAYANLTLAVAVNSRLPVCITYAKRDMSSEMQLGFKDFKSLKRVKESLFKFNRENYKGYEIIDFR